MNDALPTNFCGHCGDHLTPLEVPHSSRTCETCGKTKYFVRPGAGGKGIRLEAGDSFTIPNSWLQISFDPSRTSGKLSRAGIPVLLRHLFLVGMPNRSTEFVESIKAQRGRWEPELQASDKLAGIDFSSPTGDDEVYERLKDDMESCEWLMLMRNLHASVVLDAVKGNDTALAAHHALRVGLFQGLTVVTDPYFEEMLWHGYLAGLAIHECRTASDQVPGEVEALTELDPLFRRIGEATLRTWVDSESSIGTRIGVSAIPEKLLVARAKWHLDEFSRLRAEEAKQPAETRARWEFRMKWLTWAGSILGSAYVSHLLTRAGLFQ